MSEARRIFVDDLVGTLQVIALDAKIQVDFNPEVVSRYRLLGYENRRVADEDFRNDEVDAGEIGAGHNVTALYELKLHDTQAEPLGTVYVRHQDPDSGEVIEVRRDYAQNEMVSDFREAVADVPAIRGGGGVRGDTARELLGAGRRSGRRVR